MSEPSPQAPDERANALLRPDQMAGGDRVAVLELSAWLERTEANPEPPDRFWLGNITGGVPAARRRIARAFASRNPKVGLIPPGPLGVSEQTANRPPHLTLETVWNLTETQNLSTLAFEVEDPYQDLDTWLALAQTNAKLGIATVLVTGAPMEEWVLPERWQHRVAIHTAQLVPLEGRHHLIIPDGCPNPPERPLKRLGSAEPPKATIPYGTVA